MVSCPLQMWAGTLPSPLDLSDLTNHPTFFVNCAKEDLTCKSLGANSPETSGFDAGDCV